MWNDLPCIQSMIGHSFTTVCAWRTAFGPSLGPLWFRVVGLGVLGGADAIATVQLAVAHRHWATSCQPPDCRSTRCSAANLGNGAEIAEGPADKVLPVLLPWRLLVSIGLAFSSVLTTFPNTQCCRAIQR